MMELRKMFVTLEIDRAADAKNYYISLGGFECGGKKFDFCSYRGTISDNPKLVDFTLSDFDEDFSEGAVITPEDIRYGFTKFNVFTGEYDDPEINVSSVKEVTFLFYDPDTKEETEIEATEPLLNGINACIAGKIPYYYLSSSSYRDGEYGLVEASACAGILYSDKVIDNLAAAGEFYDNEQGTEWAVEYYYTAEELKKRIEADCQAHRDFELTFATDFAA